MAEIYLDDLLSVRDRGISCATRFLNEAELALTIKELKIRSEDFIIFGGYAYAVRARIIFPAYWEKETIITSEYVVSLKIAGSSFSKLRHSDFLGALTGLGISRDVLGDIVVSEDAASAVLFCEPSIEKFLLSEPQPLERVGREKVHTSSYCIGDDFDSRHSFETITCHVSSMRLDCVTAAVCSLSREKAKDIIISSNAVLNYVDVTSPDRTLIEGDVLSIRGKGKFRIERISGITKRGRIRLDVIKYI